MMLKVLAIFAALSAALSLVPTTVGEDQKAQLPHSLEGKVLDVFGNNQILISFGSVDGARKGFVVYLLRLEPRPIFVGSAELMEVGAKHSVGRLISIGLLSGGKVQENDKASWINPNIGINPNPVFPEIPRLPGQWQRGGAIIDLTLPRAPK